LAELLLKKLEINRYFTLPPQLTIAYALSGETPKHKNHIFSVKCCIAALPDFNQSLA